jgi:DnaK suppressor protein
MALTKAKLEYYKDLLLQERQAILENFADTNEEFKDLVKNSSGDLVDQAYSFYQKDMLIGLSDRENETLRQIDMALKRIEDGNYGVCEVTGKPIEEERLEAIPYTTLCIDEARKRAKRRFYEM